MNLPWVQQMGAVLPWRRTALFCGLTARNTGWMCCSHCHGIHGTGFCLASCLLTLQFCLNNHIIPPISMRLL